MDEDEKEYHARQRRLECLKLARDMCPMAVDAEKVIQEARLLYAYVVTG